MDNEAIKSVIRAWILRIDENDTLPKDIKALNFGLYEPYGMELIGAKVYDPQDDDWACEEDFEPQERNCPELNIDKKIPWEKVLEDMTIILKELTAELSGCKLLKVKHITIGFADGDLVVIK